MITLIVLDIIKWATGIIFLGLLIPSLILLLLEIAKWIKGIIRQFKIMIQGVDTYTEEVIEEVTSHKLDVGELVKKGISLGKLEKYHEAVVCFDRALEINPRLSEAWYNKGIAMRRLERYHEAIACYDMILKMNPRQPEAWYNKGAVLADLERYHEAINSYEKFIEFAPRYGNYMIEHAAHVKVVEEAIRELKRRIQGETHTEKRSEQ